MAFADAGVGEDGRQSLELLEAVREQAPGDLLGVGLFQDVGRGRGGQGHQGDAGGHADVLEGRRWRRGAVTASSCG